MGDYPPDGLTREEAADLEAEAIAAGGNTLQPYWRYGMSRVDWHALAEQVGIPGYGDEIRQSAERLQGIIPDPYNAARVAAQWAVANPPKAGGIRGLLGMKERRPGGYIRQPGILPEVSEAPDPTLAAHSAYSRVHDTLQKVGEGSYELTPNDIDLLEEYYGVIKKPYPKLAKRVEGHLSDAKRKREAEARRREYEELKLRREIEQMEAELDRRREHRARGDAADSGRATGRDTAQDRIPTEVSSAYLLLEIPVGSDREAAVVACRTLIKLYHPDKHAANRAFQQRATEMTLRIQQARDTVLAWLERASP
ncbi:MAG: hypothetical protein EP329_02485 [Deltaproteobacteria bacterium]|nr:MAG: hypothetical protein EP329_02485 [Deltaproteobacteria bacterium]